MCIQYSRVISRNLKLREYIKMLGGVNLHEAQNDTPLTLKLENVTLSQEGVVTQLGGFTSSPPRAV